MPSVTVSPGTEEPVALEGTSITGPNTGLEGTDVVGPSSGCEGTSVASAGNVERGIDSTRSRVNEKTCSVLEDIPGIGGKENTAETTVDSTQRTPHEILGDFAEDWLETQDKDKIKSISLFLCYHFMRAFSFTETKAAEYAASMTKKSDRTVRRWRSALINNNGVLPKSEQGH